MNDSLGTWKYVEIAGKPADVYEPSRVGNARFAMLYLHGHDLKTPAHNETFAAEFERHGLPVVCPHGQRSWWTEAICSEFDAVASPLDYLVRQVVPWIENRFHLVPPAIGLMGIGMGGQGALQLAYRRPLDFPVVAAISPAVDFHTWYGRGLPLDTMFSSREAARQQTATLRINPLNWPRHQLLVCDPADAECFEGVDRLAMKLSSMGIPFESDFETGKGGHSWEYFNSMAAPVVRFLAERLEQESRRIS